MSGAIRQLLREKFAPPAYALFEEVKNQTGYAKHAQRYADALALSLWPSRGIGLTGFEIKVSRADWKKELDDPSKAAEFSKYCNGWYVVAPEGIVERLELPATWGLLEVPAKGRKRLVTRVAAPELVPEAWDRSFVAALLRRQHEQLTSYVNASTRAQLAGEREKQKAEHEETLLRATRAEGQIRTSHEGLLRKLGLTRYEGDSPELELALSRLQAQLNEVKAEQSILYAVQGVTQALRQLARSSEQTLTQFDALEAFAKEAARHRQEFFRQQSERGVAR